MIAALLFWVSMAVGVQAQNQLAGTAWQGTIMVAQPATVVFEFKADTVTMSLVPSRQLLETMTYTATDSTFTWKKVSGGSPCDTQTPGTLGYKIKDDEITFTLISDACAARANAGIGEPFRKIAFAGK